MGGLFLCIGIMLSSIVVKGGAQTYTEQLNEDVIYAAEEANAEYKKVIDPKERQKHEYEIPPKYWNDTISSLKPLGVYTHSYNIVIALKRQDGIEEGVYIYEIISSFAPMPGVRMDGL